MTRILVPNLPLFLHEIEFAPRALTQKAADILRINSDRITNIRVRRRSLDARRRNRPHFVCSVSVEVNRFDGEPERFGAQKDNLDTQLPFSPAPSLSLEPRPIIVGAGPAGLFCALALIEAGIAPVILERGRPVEKRKLDIAKLYRTGLLDTDSNVSFGEGGAGTFTDGKLSTGKRGALVKKVLRLLVDLGGADSDILVWNKPHLGSEKLWRIVLRLRNYLLQAGCEIRFENKVTGLSIRKGRVHGLKLAHGDVIETNSVVLAPGNAARELFLDLIAVPGLMNLKPMAVGFRVEHPQELIDSIQYGPSANHPALPPADYSLSAQTRDRGAWTFCMCPGGVVVPTPTENNALCINGMSSSRRAGRRANSAVVVEVGPKDYASFGFGTAMHAPIEFQRAIEIKAFDAGGGMFMAPAQRLTDFLAGRPIKPLLPSSYPRGLTEYDLSRLYPDPLVDSIRDALVSFGRRMPGFITEEAMLIGVETRTSSPYTFPRKSDGSSVELPGLFPCGEGCGHGGGIVSAAADGLQIGKLLANHLLGSQE